MILIATIIISVADVTTLQVKLGYCPKRTKLVVLLSFTEDEVHYMKPSPPPPGHVA
jgi:hypothetical protein